MTEIKLFVPGRIISESKGIAKSQGLDCYKSLFRVRIMWGYLEEISQAKEMKKI